MSLSALSVLLAFVLVGFVSSPAEATPGTDDYPANLKNAAQDSVVDPWAFYNRECTSFVAWRLNNDNHVGFTNYMRGPNGSAGHFGDAANWGPNARKIGFPVNGTPAVGAVAWWSSGHVAWVRAVNGGTVAIEEYNRGYDGHYGTRTINASAPSGYIHIADLNGTSAGNDPQGSFDGATGLVRNAVRITGWAFDKDQPTTSLRVHAYVDGPAGSGARGVDLGIAQQVRNDVANAYPGVGPNHGIDATVSGVGPGSHTIYLYAINIASGNNVLIGTKSVSVPTTPAGSPIGNLENAYGLPGGAVRLSGWTVDPDAAVPTDVHAYIDGPAGSGARFVSLGTANIERRDVGNAFPGTGDAHGFDTVVGSISPGWHTAWVYAINAADGGDNPLVLEREFYVPAGAPIGSLDNVTSVGNGTVRLTGWSDDPEAPTAATAIHVYVDGPAGTGRLVTADTANLSRQDVTRVYPTATGPHGFDTAVNGIAPGDHTFYVYAINAAGPGDNPLLGSKTINVPTPAAGSPYGSLDVVEGRSGSLHLRGWAIDPDALQTPVTIHVYVGGPAGATGVAGYNVGTASLRRDDVGTAFPPAGAAHGYDVVIHGIRAGRHPVYVYAINIGTGANATIGGGTPQVTRDAQRPTTRLTSPAGGTTTAHRITVRWRSIDTGSGVATTQIRWRGRPADAKHFSRWRQTPAYSRLQGTSATSPVMASQRLYCYQARSRDRAGNTSAWSNTGCVRTR